MEDNTKLIRRYYIMNCLRLSSRKWGSLSHLKFTLFANNCHSRSLWLTVSVVYLFPSFLLSNYLCLWILSVSAVERILLKLSYPVWQSLPLTVYLTTFLCSFWYGWSYLFHVAVLSLMLCLFLCLHLLPSFMLSKSFFSVLF